MVLAGSLGRTIVAALAALSVLPLAVALAQPSRAAAET